MGIINKLFGSKQVTQKAAQPIYGRSIELPLDNVLAAALSGDSIIRPMKAFDYYRQNASLATAVDMIASAIEQISPVLEMNDKLSDESEVIELLQQPNGFETRTEFMGKLARHWLLTHNAYLLGLGNINRAPLEIYAPKPFHVFVQEAIDGYPDSYRINEGVGKGSYVRDKQKVGQLIRFLSSNLREIYSISGFSSRPTDTVADSPLSAIFMDIEQQLKGKVHNVKLLENGGRPSMVITFKDENGIADADEQKARRDIINEQLSGSENAGKIAVISGPEISVSELGKSNKDMDFANLDQMASRAVYLRYGIPLPLVSTDASTYNNVASAIVYFYEHTVIPNYQTILSGLSKMLLPRFGIDPKKARLTFDPETIKPLMSKMLDELKLRKDIGVETINELRESIPGREPIEGGDVLYQPANLLPVGTDITSNELPTMTDEGANAIANNKRFFV